MAVGWMTALKLVPWNEVIEATPQILQAARRLMGSAQRAPAGPSPTPGTAGATAALGVSTGDQLAVMREALLQLQDEQRASATLIESLAEQNAVLVRAVDALRVRQQRLLWAVGALGAATLGLLVWAFNQ
ncbi:hypothetical protein [Acidovorax sp. FG27]|uniref:hypothetical protein n=1 Tax=Acidovorax sp. FG27 TaxID=3133652 RepID=UPI0033417317